MNENAPHLAATYAPGSDDYYGVPAVLDTLSPLSPVNYHNTTHGSSGHEQQNLTSFQENGSNGWSHNTQYTHTAAQPISQQEEAFPTHGVQETIQQRPQLARGTSIFPKVFDRPPNVPPSDEEQEMILEDARSAVLNSADPEMQLNWAFDTLAYVDTAMEDDRRTAAFRPARPSTPPIERQLREDAINIVGFLADQEHPRADYIRGMWLEFGKFGHTQNKGDAFRCYKRAAMKGYARAHYRMGMQFESTNESAKAMQQYRSGERSGDAACCYRIGMISLLGQLGQPRDYDEGIRLIRHAAEMADENAPQGAYVFGMLLAQELPQVSVPEVYLPPDLDAGRMYIEQSAFLGFAKAQVKLGAAYELCSLGCEFSPALSLHYNRLAARQGEAEAELAISKWYLCGHDGIFERSDQLAYEYAQRAALSGLATAEFALGYFNEIGVEVPVDLDKARDWYTKAAKRGNQDAITRLADLSLHRSLSKKEHENVAITRIRSQHGSKRGGRPERFTRASSIMPSIPDDTPVVHMADAHIFTNPGYARVVSPVSNQALPFGPEPPPNVSEHVAMPEALTNTYTDIHTPSALPQHRQASPAFAAPRSDSPSVSHLRQTFETATPPPPPPPPSEPQPEQPTVPFHFLNFDHPQKVLNFDPPQHPALQTISPNIQPSVSGPPRSLSPTRKPVPSRVNTPLSRQPSPAPPKLELGFMAAPLDPLMDESLANYQLQEPLKRLSRLSIGGESTSTSTSADLNMARVDTPQLSAVDHAKKPASVKPSRGPQSFEEMGVPMAKQEQDCTVM